MARSASTISQRSTEVAGKSGTDRPWLLTTLRTYPVLWIGILALAVPTLIRLATEIWATEEGAHGPIVLASGAWLLVRTMPEIRAVASPGRQFLVGCGLAAGILAYLLARTIGVLGLEAAAVAFILLVVFYSFVGWAGLRAAWFSLIYLGFLVPLPDTIVALVTQPLKLSISGWAAHTLQALGYPVANTGVTLQVAQYELLVAAACSGLNAMISLSAIGLFYVYLLHRSSWRYAAIMMCAVIPAAIFANFVRVIILILITYHFGDAAAQGFLHGAAGLATFALAILFIFGIDSLLSPLRRRLSDQHEQD